MFIFVTVDKHWIAGGRAKRSNPMVSSYCWFVWAPGYCQRFPQGPYLCYLNICCLTLSRLQPAAMGLLWTVPTTEQAQYWERPCQAAWPEKKNNLWQQRFLPSLTPSWANPFLPHIVLPPPHLPLPREALLPSSSKAYCQLLAVISIACRSLLVLSSPQVLQTCLMARLQYPEPAVCAYCRHYGV